MDTKENVRIGGASTATMANDAAHLDDTVTVKVYMPRRRKLKLAEEAERTGRSLSEYLGTMRLGRELKGLHGLIATVDLRVMNIELRKMRDALHRDGVDDTKALVEEVLLQVQGALEAITSCRNREAERTSAPEAGILIQKPKHTEEQPPTSK